MFTYFLVLAVVLELGEAPPQFISGHKRADHCIAEAAEKNHKHKAELDPKRGQMFLCLQILFPA
jgi:hypothetical protein